MITQYGFDYTEYYVRKRTSVRPVHSDKFTVYTFCTDCTDFVQIVHCTLKNLRNFVSQIDHVSTSETLLHDRESCDADSFPLVTITILHIPLSCKFLHFHETLS